MIRYFFLREKPSDPKHRGNPIGCVASQLDRENNKLLFNFSLTNNEHDRFDRHLARKVAIGRLEKQPFVVEIDATKISALGLHKYIMDFFVNNSNLVDSKTKFNLDSTPAKVPEVPYRLKKLAKTWLALKKVAQ